MRHDVPLRSPIFLDARCAPHSDDLRFFESGRTVFRHYRARRRARKMRSIRYVWRTATRARSSGRREIQRGLPAKTRAHSQEGAPLIPSGYYHQGIAVDPGMINRGASIERCGR